jgi:hypothetical protein
VALKPFRRLLLLLLDNNHLDKIGEMAHYNLGELQYLNLESNRLPELHQNVHKQDVRLAYNRLTVLSGSAPSPPCRDFRQWC